MDKLIIQGGVPLSGEIRVSGAKNAALPLMCAALLTDEQLTLSNVPHLRDVSTMLRLLAQMGVEVSLDDRLGLSLRAERLSDPLAPYDLVKTMRASILVLGPLLARCGGARVSRPGGCAIGTRHSSLAAGREKRPENQDRSAHGLHQVVRGERIGQTLRPQGQTQPVVERDFHPHLREQPQHG